MAKPKASIRKAHERICELALSLPEAYEDWPWGERVAKVKKKVFVFLGKPDGERVGFAVKLSESADDALTLPYTSPTGYGLGKSGWVDVEIRDDADLDLFESFIEESYRSVAPKKLAALLDDDADPGPRAAPKKKKKKRAKKKAQKSKKTAPKKKKRRPPDPTAR